MNIKVLIGLILTIMLSSCSLHEVKQKQDPKTLEWRMVTFGKIGSLEARLKIRTRASLAHPTCVYLEVVNRGTEAIKVIRTPCRLDLIVLRPKTEKERETWKSFLWTDANLFAEVPENPGSGGPVKPILVLPGESRVSSVPLFDGTRLGWPSEEGLVVQGFLKISLEVDGTAGFSAEPRFTMDWLVPDTEEVKSMQDEVRGLLRQTLVVSFARYSTRLKTLLSLSEVAAGIPMMEILTSLDHVDSQNYGLKTAVITYLNAQFSGDVGVKAYFLERLRNRSFEALGYFGNGFLKVWHPEFTEPIITMYEVNPAGLYWVFHLLMNHRADWVDHKPLAFRFYSAVIQGYPELRLAPTLLKVESNLAAWKIGVGLLLQLGMKDGIKTLEPFTACELIAEEHQETPLGMVLPARITPLRVCDLALHAILELSGEDVCDAYARACRELSIPALSPITKANLANLNEHPVMKIRSHLLQGLKANIR